MAGGRLRAPLCSQACDLGQVPRDDGGLTPTHLTASLVLNLRDWPALRWNWGGLHSTGQVCL